MGNGAPEWETGILQSMPTDFPEGTGKDRGQGICPTCEKTDWIHRTVFEKQWSRGWGLINKIQGQANKGKLMFGLPAKHQSKGSCWWRFFILTTGNIVFPCSDPAGALLDISWKSSTVSCKQSRRLLEAVEDNFLIQVYDNNQQLDQRRSITSPVA